MVPDRARYSIGFSEFNFQDNNGFYLALSENDLPNVLEYEKYFHLGTYDVFITYAHELFHLVEQPKWERPEKYINASRNDRLEDVEARTQRNLLYKQVLTAVAEKDSIKKDLYIKDVVSSYKKYKESYPEDFKNSTFMDRLEGSAFYFELISSMYSAYPNQIKTEEDLYTGLQLIAKHTDSDKEIGLGEEGYWLPGWTGVLLDQIEKKDKNKWKNRLMSSPELTSLEILSTKYKNEDLPVAVQFTQEDQRKVEKMIEERRKNKSVLPRTFKFFYQMIF